MAQFNETLLAERRAYSEKRLADFGEEIKGLPVLREMPNLCIYVTGSYGRLEASEASDIDLFFVHSGTEKDKKNRISRVNKTLLDAKLIKTAREHHYPEFANDGQYLDVHYLGDLLAALGGPGDDWYNYFTARMLLLLESRPIFNKDEYTRAVKKTIDSYCRDYEDHSQDFRAIFLINDILRYWRTMCLNYEHRRNRQQDAEKNVGPATKKEAEEQRNKHHLRNLKLKFSRMLICFSAVLRLVQEDKHATPEKLLDIVQLSPMERLNAAAEKIKGGEQLVAAVKENYAWFLDVTGNQKEDVLEWIGKENERKMAFQRAQRFGGDMYRLIDAGARNGDIMRYLVL